VALALLLVAAVVIIFSLADAAQRRYVPSGYMEPIDIWVGLDPQLTLPKLAFRFFWPLSLGVLITLVLRIFAEVSDAPTIAAAAGALSAYVIIYPPLTRRTLRPSRLYRRTRAVTLAYFTFVALNSALAYMASSLARVFAEWFAAQVGASVFWPTGDDVRAIFNSIVAGMAVLIILFIWRTLVKHLMR
jgi:hypothetical protein